MKPRVYDLPTVALADGTFTLKFTAALADTPFTVPGTTAQAFGTTQCEVRRGRRTYSGLAYCSVSDSFSAPKGRKVAFADALSGIKNKQVRAELWDIARLAGLVP